MQIAKCRVVLGLLISFVILPVGGSIRAEGGSSAGPTDGEIRRLEAGLLHKKLDFGSVRGWDRGSQQWLPFRRGREQLLVVQFWAVECAPCVAEMPMMRAMVHGWSEQKDVRWVFVSETLDDKKMLDFWHHSNKDRVPEVDVHQSTDSRLRDALGLGHQPMTLLLDHDLVIRQAFIGSLEARKHELVPAINRLASAVGSRK